MVEVDAVEDLVEFAKIERSGGTVPQLTKPGNAPLLQTLRVQSRGPPGFFLETALTSLKYQAIFQAIGLNALE